MPDVRIKSPNLDDIFEKWTQKANRTQNKKLEKQFGTKGAVFSISNISAAETVKDSLKEAAIYFSVKRIIAPSKKEVKKEEIEAESLRKVTFYQFQGDVSKENWDEDEMVPFFNSIKPVQCKKCKGKGFIEDKCKECGGTGTITEDLVVLEGEEAKKTKKPFKYPCGACYGTGTVKNRCKNCGGSKNFYSYEIRPVPFKRIETGIPVLHSSAQTKYEKELEEDLHKLIDEVEGIEFDKFKDLKKKIEPSLGYFNKAIKKTLKSAEKAYKKFEKDDDTEITSRIILFPMNQLICETKKGKSFEIYSIGSQNGFLVYSNF
ncbi:MAG: hypothetical protein EU551_04335 [Promethearchaeota archaeon]|nr:MAG: hypothetical protein EU551_04335 [Candidatus Lokiarchaeota archaeon]